MYTQVKNMINMVKGGMIGCLRKAITQAATALKGQLDAIIKDPVKGLGDAEKVYHELVAQIVRLAEHGLVHGDYNEFNLMVSEE